MIEARIRQLQEQLRQERREANRKETELRRRKKAILLKQEQQLRKQLEVSGWGSVALQCVCVCGECLIVAIKLLVCHSH